ncbi:hypothetical protein H5T53_06330 [Candidatus Bipolaricaulota bacterium]|nr:hypothetical protein [Candidatus Bipolaricaulota bacterium]
MSDWELKTAARAVAEYMCNIRKGENVVVYADTAIEESVAESIAEAAHVAGGEVILIRYRTRSQVDMEPPSPLAAALQSADVIIELAAMFLIHTRALSSALDRGARYACLTGVTSDIMKRCIRDTEFYSKVIELGEAIAEMLRKAKKLHITTGLGTALTCDIQGRPIDHASKRIFGPKEQSYLGGQVSWYPRPESLNGTLVITGSIWPPDELGLIRNPIRLAIQEGRVVGVTGGAEAEVLKRWFSRYTNANIYNLAHISYGLNPGARLTGNILEDERVFGCIEVGIGAQPPHLGIFDIDRERDVDGHTDAIILNPTVELDGEVIERDGRFVHPKVVALIQSFWPAAGELQEMGP